MVTPVPNPPFRPVTIEDTRVVTHEAATTNSVSASSSVGDAAREAAVCANCSHDEHHGECTRWVANLSGGRLCGCTQPAPVAAAPSEEPYYRAIHDVTCCLTPP